MNKYEKLRSMCSSSKILCGTDVYNLLEEDYMKELVSKIKDGTVTVKSKMALGTDKVQRYEIFLHNLDRFVYYLRDRLFINPTEFRIYLGYLIESNYIDKILFSKELFEDDSFKFEVYFWQIASERLLGVLGVMSMLDPIRERLEELKREIILNCSEKKHYKYKTTTIYRKCYDERTINYTSKKIGIKEGRGYDPDLEEYLVEYDELVYPIEAILIERILDDDNEALEELLDILYNPKKRPTINEEYTDILAETKEKIVLVSKQISAGEINLEKGLFQLKQLKEKLEEIKSYIEINKNQKPVSLYYQSIKESFIFHPVAMLPIKDFNKTLEFFDYDTNRDNYDKKITRIKSKIKKNDK